MSELYRPDIQGCSDGNCIFQDNRKGMHTNGGCQCERELRRHPNGFKAVQTIKFLRNQINEMEDDLGYYKTKSEFWDGGEI